jgi:hypothetical protein
MFLDDDEHVKGTITELQNEVIKMNKEKRKMQNAFEDAVKQRFLKAEILTIEKLAQFAEMKDNAINKINGPLTENNRKRLEELKLILHNLDDDLMQIELTMQTSIEDTKGGFENDLKKITEEIQGYVSKKFP